MQMKKFCCLLSSLALAVSLISCGDQNSEKTSQPKVSTQKQTEIAPKAVASKPNGLSGKVLETFDSGGYTYVRVDSDTGEKWVAAPQAQVTVGEDASFADGQVMQNFHSKTLNRTFEEIIFTAGIIGKDPASETTGMGAGSFAEAIQGSGANTMGQNGSMGSGKAVVPFADLKIEKATGENGYTVGEVYEKSADLNTQKVMVKGQVMKVSLNIMGKNWLHLQDGTGDPAGSTHDLVVTTSAAVPEKGDVVTIEGTLAANKDFGFGYKYAVIVEDAEITR